MSYTYDRDKMPTIHPDLGKFDFVVAKDKREWAQCKGIGSKEWIEFANLMFEQFPFIYNTCLLMNDEQKANAETIRQQQAEIDRLTEQRDSILDSDKLAEIIRKVDGSHNLGAGALAEALIAEIEAGK